MIGKLWNPARTFRGVAVLVAALGVTSVSFADDAVGPKLDGAQLALRTTNDGKSAPRKGKSTKPKSTQSKPKAPPPATNPHELAERTFKFHYSATIDKLAPGTMARVWIPVAPSNGEQDVQVLEVKAPGETRETNEVRFGNPLIYFAGTANDAGEIPLSVEYLVTRKPITPEGTEAEADVADAYLASNTLVPVNGEIAKLFFGDMLPQGETVDIARKLYDAVDARLTYDKTGEGWGRGDALWACDSKHGNCTDFHSIFIALCRDLKVPAKFEMGFPVPAGQASGEIPGYHCWARYLDHGRWMGVDISEADKHPDQKEFLFGNLPADRVMFTTERDLELEPMQDAGPVNFLIYPYVEVDGKIHASQKRQFKFEEVKSES